MQFLTRILCLGFLSAASAAGASKIDLTEATIVIVGDDALHQQAAVMLQEEIAQRTGVTLTTAGNAGTGASIVLGQATQLAAHPAPAGLAVPAKAEAYSIYVNTAGAAPTVVLAGQDRLGVLFAAGRLLRALELTPGSVALESTFQLATAPYSPVRGHQFGYRNTANSYDAWDMRQFEEYFRDLIAFGVNAIELIPDLDPNMKDSPALMTETMWARNQKLVALIHQYGLQAWYWLPVNVVDSEEAVQKELALQKALFESAPVDAVFVPGGDPGDNTPENLMPFLEKMVAQMKTIQPNAQLWLSNQGFTHEYNAYFYKYLNEQKPAWLAGVVYGPWAKQTLHEMREQTPAQYPVRRYPDICHNVRCEFAVPQWDPAFAHTLGREPYNPRPLAYAHIHNMGVDASNGFISYSDGVSDDVNKFIWSALSWDPKQPVQTILEEYGDYFIREDLAEEVAEIQLAFEQHWVGPAAENKQIRKTLKQLQRIEKRGEESLHRNWRFQFMLLRAYFDDYVQRRLKQETQREQVALKALARGVEGDVDSALLEAEAALKGPDNDPKIATHRAELEELGKRMWESIQMQLDVKRYNAKNPERGAILEYLDTALNNREWLESEMRAVRAHADEAAKREHLAKIVSWEQPGEGSFYDDLGNAFKEPHLVQQLPWEQDPSYVHSTQDEFMEKFGWRISWQDQAETLYGTPLEMKYDNLDPQASYRIRVTYAGRFRAKMTLKADGHEVHGPEPQVEPVPAAVLDEHLGIRPPDPAPPILEFDIPQAATSDGNLHLVWDLVEGRGCQVGEVWLLKQ